VREAAQRVHRAEEAIRRWIWTGRLPARKLGNRYYVEEQDLDAIAADVPAPRRSAELDLALGDWVSAVKAWHAGLAARPVGGAGQLVIEDREERSGLGSR
jgi:excisionase family DNA binding protein